MKKLNLLYATFYGFVNYKMEIEKLEAHTHLSYEERVIKINNLNKSIDTYRQLIKEQEAKLHTINKF